MEAQIPFFLCRFRFLLLVLDLLGQFTLKIFPGLSLSSVLGKKVLSKHVTGLNMERRDAKIREKKETDD